jgi:virulence factor Mce-like protein
MRQRPASSLAGSPILIGTVTVLITVIAVFLAYNANSGLPFVPTYKLEVQVPNAVGLVEGNEVRVGGKRVGTVDRIVGERGERDPHATLSLKLDKAIQPLRDDTQVTVRPRSPLGLKYLELTPGERGRPLADGARLPLARARGTVELDEVINTFDSETRTWLKRTIDDAGPGLAGRGVEFNETVAAAPDLFLRLGRVMANLSDPRTGLRPTIRALARVADEVEPVSAELGSLVAAGERTLAALDSVKPQLQATISGLPPVELEAIRTLRAARPLLRDARGLMHDLRPGIGELPRAARRLHSALQVGIPVLRRASALSDRLNDSLEEVYRLAVHPSAQDVLRRLRRTLDSAIPTLRFVAPVQVQCNYIGVYLRNITSTISEGDAAGTWLRTLVIANPDQATSQSEPAPDLHVNPYPYTAAPGQQGLCEAGNEPYAPGQRFGHAPGVTATYTEDIEPAGGASR